VGTYFSLKVEGLLMRMMLTAQLSTSAANPAMTDGRFGKMLETLMARAKPEAAYFTATDGERSAVIFFDLVQVSDIPWICEPLFMTANAKVELKPVMTADDVQAGLAKVAQG
jgi:hypothetical protein